MNIVIVGNVTKDVYLNLDNRTETFETDKNHTKWLDISFNASEHHFFDRESNYGGGAVSLEVLQKLGINSSISDSNLQFSDHDSDPSNNTATTHRYILVSDGGVSYLSPSSFTTTNFIPPSASVDYLYLDRSANPDAKAIKQINTYLDLSANTKLVIYIKDTTNSNLNSLIPRANLIFLEQSPISELSYAPELANIDAHKIISISENQLSYLNIPEHVSIDRVDMLTHLSAYSIASATILGCFALGYSVEKSLKMARANVENSRLNSVLSLDELTQIAETPDSANNLELIAANLVLHPKGILAADESGGSIHKKFEQLNIPDTYDTRRDYRNLFFTTPNLETYVNGIILFDETARQIADDGQNFVDFLTTKGIIPGIKVDQGLVQFGESNPSSSAAHPEETWTKGLEGLEERLKEYYLMGLRFAKWRAAFEIRLDESGNIITPTEQAISENCRILAKYAKKCQSAGLVPIVEPELVYDGDYTIEQSTNTTGHILDVLFHELISLKINLRACILKCNMVIAGKQYATQSTPTEVGTATAKVLQAHVPEDLAGVVFLSGGQTPEQATDNLSAILQNGPFPWPVTFSFARALQDPALYAWAGDNTNADKARQAFQARLLANQTALKSNKAE